MKIILTLCVLGLTPNAVGDTLTLREAEAAMLKNNVQIQLASNDTVLASARLTEARQWDNPEITFIHNAYNPLNHRWLDMGSEGETDVSFSQPIAIGGQRRFRIRSAQATLRAVCAEAAWTRFEAQMQLRCLMAETYAVQCRAAALDAEIESVSRIIVAYGKQPDNIARIELQRLETLRLELLMQQTCWQDSLAACAGQLMLMTGIKNITAVSPLSVAQTHPFDGSVPYSTARLDALQAAAQAAEAEVKWQRAQALPHISLVAEYDKNGNIAHNFWAAGLCVSLPVWNRGQGAIREARLQYSQHLIEHRAAQQQRETALSLAKQRLERQFVLADEVRKLSFWDIEAAERQYLLRNISLVELIDLYSAYREAQALVIDIEQGLIEAAVAYNLAAGSEVIAIQ